MDLENDLELPVQGEAAAHSDDPQHDLSCHIGHLWWVKEHRMVNIRGTRKAHSMSMETQRLLTLKKSIDLRGGLAKRTSARLEKHM